MAEVTERESNEITEFDTVPGRIARALRERLDRLERGAQEAGSLRPNNALDAATYTHAIGEVRDAFETAVELTRDGIPSDPDPREGPIFPEWIAWRHLCEELKGLASAFVISEGSGAGDLDPDDVNGATFDPAIKAIRRWGEELVALRLTQGSQEISRARDEARDAYPKGGEPIE